MRERLIIQGVIQPGLDPVLHGQARARQARMLQARTQVRLSRVPLRKWLAMTVHPDIPSSECSARGAWPRQLVAPPGSQR